MNKYIKLSLFSAAGALLGFAYYYFIGCKNGCAIQSNPFLSTLYGAAFGFILGFPVKKKENPESEKNP